MTTTADKEIFLVTGVNEPYFPNAIRFIETMNTNSNVNNIIITLGFTVSSEITAKYPKVKFIHLDPDLVKAKNPNTCMQHGGFLAALDVVSDDDIIIFTDADIEVQRPFSIDELTYLLDFSNNDIGVSYNKSPDQTLIEEGQNLTPLTDDTTILAAFPDADRLSVFNTGVVIAKKSTYQALYQKYVRDWEQVSKLFEHYAKQQWLLSYLIQKAFNVKLLNDEIHTHNHYPIELRVQRAHGYKFCIDNEPVLFAHHIQPTTLNITAISKTIRKTKKQQLFWKWFAGFEALLIILLALALLLTL